MNVNRFGPEALVSSRSNQYALSNSFDSTLRIDPNALLSSLIGSGMCKDGDIDKIEEVQCVMSGEEVKQQTKAEK